MGEIKATKAEIAKLKSDIAVRNLHHFINIFEGHISHEYTDAARDAIDLLIRRYGKPKQKEEAI